MTGSIRTRDRIYNIWYDMKRRCYNENRHNYISYGGRGVIVCDQWKNSIVNFRNWALSNGYEAWLTLERLNTDGNYTPFNCKWADKYEQANNRSNNHVIEYDGYSRTIFQWSRALDVSYEALKKRVQYWAPDYERIFTQPYGKLHKKKTHRKPKPPEKFKF